EAAATWGLGAARRDLTSSSQAADVRPSGSKARRDRRRSGITKWHDTGRTRPALQDRPLADQSDDLLLWSRPAGSARGAVGSAINLVRDGLAASQALVGPQFRQRSEPGRDTLEHHRAPATRAEPGVEIRGVVCAGGHGGPTTGILRADRAPRRPASL